MNQINKNIGFYSLFAIYLIVGGWFLATHSFGTEILLINQKNNLISDVFFKYSTHLGDGLFYWMVLIIIALFVSYYKAIEGIIAFLFSTILIQVPKRLIFDDYDRPASYFAHKVNLHFVEGVKIHHHNSFPSGHTGTAFTLALFLSMFTNNKKLQMVYLLLAVLVAFSRMYLCQHFLRDVFVGAILGTLATILASFIFRKLVPENQYDKLNNALLKK